MSWFFGIYCRLDTRLQNYAAHQVQADQQRARCEQAADASSALQKASEYTERMLRSYRCDSSYEDTFQESLIFLFDAIGRSGVALKSCVIEKKSDKGWYVQGGLVVRLAGSIKQIDLFLHAVSSVAHMSCRQIELRDYHHEVSDVLCSLAFFASKAA
jgi:hypothetical protein